MIFFCDFIEVLFIISKMLITRLYRFGAYASKQYYVLEKRIVHECLESEGGSGVTYMIHTGPAVYAEKGWR